MATTPPDPLAGSRIFGALRETDRKKLAAQMRERMFKAGDELLAEGNSGVGFWSMLEGEASVRVGDRDVRTVKAGGSFGELAVIDGGARTATVIAKTDGRALVLTVWNFRAEFMKDSELCWRLLVEVTGKLREAEARSGD